MSTYNPPRDDGNHRVSNAILSTKLDAVILEVQKLTASVDRRLAFLEEKTDIKIGELETNCRSMQTDMARLDERQKAATGILGAFAFIASSVAGVIGSVVK